jgi:hypothetical protein
MRATVTPSRVLDQQRTEHAASKTSSTLLAGDGGNYRAVPSAFRSSHFSQTDDAFVSSRMASRLNSSIRIGLDSVMIQSGNIS